MSSALLFAVLAAVPTSPSKASFPKGVLSIEASPSSEIYVDGKAMGWTPMKLPMHTGEAKITLRGPRGQTASFVRLVVPGHVTKLKHKFERPTEGSHRFEPSATLPSWAASAVRNPEGMSPRLQELKKTERADLALALASVIALRSRHVAEGPQIRAELDKIMRFTESAKLLELFERLRAAEGKPVAKPTGGCDSDASQPFGYATISTKPYSTIYIDGQKIGETPIPRHKLAPGCHVLEARDGKGRTVKTKIKIEPRTTSIWEFDMKRTGKRQN